MSCAVERPEEEAEVLAVAVIAGLCICSNQDGGEEKKLEPLDCKVTFEICPQYVNPVARRHLSYSLCWTVMTDIENRKAFLTYRPMKLEL